MSLQNQKRGRRKMTDVRGLSCPQPVLMMMKVMQSHEDSYEVLSDQIVSVENIKRYAAREGYSADVREENGEFYMTLTKCVG